MITTSKKSYDFESFELDNIYNDDDNREVRVDSSIWYN